MVEISIICLIYRSTKLADWVYESLYEFTPMLRNGKAEFLFVANDPTELLLSHLIKKRYPFILNNNKQYTDEELFSMGYGIPEYMNRVYKGYNQGILHAKGKLVVLINSDNYFSDDWLENLVKYSDYKKIVTSTLVEPGHPRCSIFPGAYKGSFGNHPDNFQKEAFLGFANKIRITGLKTGGAYMPCLVYRDIAFYAGLYPEGNIAGDTFNEVSKYGDEYFYSKMHSLGIMHVTSKDSIVYHLKEGERDDSPNSTSQVGDLDLDGVVEAGEYRKMPMIAQSDLCTVIVPNVNHNKIIKKLLGRVTLIITTNSDSDYLELAIQSALGQTYKNIEVIVIDHSGFGNHFSEKIVESYKDRLRYYEIAPCLVADALNFGLKKMTGEYVAWMTNMDRCSPDRIEKMMNRIIENEKNDIVITSDFELVRQDNVVLERMTLLADISGKILVSEREKNTFNPCTMLISKKCFEIGGMFDGEIDEMKNYSCWQSKMTGIEFIHITEILMSRFSPVLEEKKEVRRSYAGRIIRKIGSDGILIAMKKGIKKIVRHFIRIKPK
jgi:glycosyltransferase involved in cell wall biosynthesis